MVLVGSRMCVILFFSRAQVRVFGRFGNLVLVMWVKANSKLVASRSIFRLEGGLCVEESNALLAKQ